MAGDSILTKSVFPFPTPGSLPPAFPAAGPCPGEFGPLERVAQAELELSFRSVGRPFAGDLSKRFAGWVHVRIVPVRMVGVVEGLRLEDQCVAFMAGNKVERLLERGIKALEARAIDDVARTAT